MVVQRKNNSYLDGRLMRKKTLMEELTVNLSLEGFEVMELGLPSGKNHTLNNAGKYGKDIMKENLSDIYWNMWYKA